MYSDDNFNGSFITYDNKYLKKTIKIDLLDILKPTNINFPKSYKLHVISNIEKINNIWYEICMFVITTMIIVTFYTAIKKSYMKSKN